MPYYAWRGVDILGDYKKGRMYAKAPEVLDALLFKREIALISFRTVSWRWKYRPVTQQLKIEFFKQLATLLESGVSLPESLLVTAEQLKHPGMQEIIHRIADVVEHGNALSVALCRYEHAFDPITMQLIKAGEESGALARALAQVADRLEMREEFARTLRAAALLPMVTFAFFMLITFFLFSFVVPRFAELFVSMNQQLPSSTLFMMRVSSFCMSRYAAITLLAIGIGIFFLWRFGKTMRGRRIKDKVILFIPVVNTIVRYRFIAYFLTSLSLLLERGFQLVPALQVIAASLDNTLFKNIVLRVSQEVTVGRSFSGSLQDVAGDVFPIELIAVVHVGENSGALTVLLKKAAVRYQEIVKNRLRRLTQFVQPLLMIILGLLVLLLIFAIYLPILQLSYAF